MSRNILLFLALILMTFSLSASPDMGFSKAQAQVLEEGNPPMVSTYPNPFQHELVVELQDLEGKAQLKLFNLVGHIQLQQEVGTGLTRLDVSGLPSGTYYLRIESGDQTIMKRIVKY